MNFLRRYQSLSINYIMTTMESSQKQQHTTFLKTEKEPGWNINDYLRKNKKLIQPVTKVTTAVQQPKPYIMKVLLILIPISTIHSTMTNKRMKRQTKQKDFNLNFGLSTALKERLHP